jgi:hypothetical protein
LRGRNIISFEDAGTGRVHSKRVNKRAYAGLGSLNVHRYSFLLLEIIGFFL